jgi:hypothetical protein
MDRAASSANRVSPAEPEVATPGTSSGAGYFRWVICALLLFGVTKNYMDRQVLGILKTTLQHDLGWNEIDYGNLVFAFQAAYAVGMVVVGRLVDRLGTRLGYALAMVFWSLAAMAHAFGLRGIGRFSRQHQDRCRMVPQKGAGAGNRNFQRRHKYRRHHHSPGGAVDHDSMGLALGLHHHRRFGLCLADLLAAALSQAG